MAHVKAIPEGMHTVTPHIVVAGAAKAIEFYKKAFDAVEEARLDGPGGKIMHALVRIGDSQVMLMDEDEQWKSVSPKTLKGTPVTIHLYVKDADSTFDKAVKAGAKPTMPMEDMFWGDRYGVIEDPYGHSWAIATHVRDMSPDEVKKAAKTGMPQAH